MIKFIKELLLNMLSDEFGGDFYFAENNYVVEFDVNNIPLATYNFIESIDTNNKSIKYNYVMNESDIKI